MERCAELPHTPDADGVRLRAALDRLPRRPELDREARNAIAAAPEQAGDDDPEAGARHRAGASRRSAANSTPDEGARPMTPAGVRDDGHLSVRSYTLKQNTHSHPFHQIVIPLNGAMDIACAGRRHSVGVGHCIVIPSGTVHSYGAPERSRFLVADMAHLPANAAGLEEACVAICDDLLAFCSFAETQLGSSDDRATGALLFSLFCRLLERQGFAARIDERVMRAVTMIEQDLARTHRIEELAAAACLSVSQFKALFRKALGRSCTEYQAMRRMDRARTLLANTDAPVRVVAGTVGYSDPSAFSRRFRAYFGRTPREFARRR